MLVQHKSFNIKYQSVKPKCKQRDSGRTVTTWLSIQCLFNMLKQKSDILFWFKAMIVAVYVCDSGLIDYLH